MRQIRLGLALATMCVTGIAYAADYPKPVEGDWIAKDFKFHTGEVLPEVRLHWTTVGDPKGEPVLLLHGTTQSAASLLTAAFAGELFGAGQPLDAAKYYIILPDALGSGKSLKPSEGLKTKFPAYNYDDMVDAQYRLASEGLKISHLRLVIGYSMGGMQTFLWGEKYPTYMDALVPMAATPGEMSARNWILRRVMLEMVRNDPEYNNGNYTKQPQSLKYASAFYGLATSGGTLGYQTTAGTHALADKAATDRLAAAPPPDANDWLYQWGSSADYNPTPGLGKIVAPLLVINAADDERNPPELGIMESALKQMKNGRVYLIPASSATRGHATNATATLWRDQFNTWFQAVPKQGN